MCADGTPLSSTCLAKGCDVCEETPSPAPTPNPVPKPLPAKDTLKIASFNIQVFGVTKADNKFVMDVLARTIAEFDIVAIQEIRISARRRSLTLKMPLICWAQIMKLFWGQGSAGHHQKNNMHSCIGYHR